MAGAHVVDGSASFLRLCFLVVNRSTGKLQRAEDINRQNAIVSDKLRYKPSKKPFF